MRPFKEVWGSRIIFAGLSKVFTPANKDQQRESKHGVFSLYSKDTLEDTIDYMDKRDVRFDSIFKMKTSSLMGSIKDRISIECSEKAMNISEQLPVTPSVVSAEMARVQANLEFDLILQEMKHYIVLIVWLLT